MLSSFNQSRVNIGLRPNLQGKVLYRNMKHEQEVTESQAATKAGTR